MDLVETASSVGFVAGDLENLCEEIQYSFYDEEMVNSRNEMAENRHHEISVFRHYTSETNDCF